MHTKLNRLQLIQNHAARIITHTTKFDHISGVLKKLHWLPVNKVVLLVFKSLVGIGPSYLNELLSIKTYSRYNMRYSKHTLRLSEPEMNLKTIGDRALRAYGPVQCNKLPLSLLINTHVFKQKQYIKSEK